MRRARLIVLTLLAAVLVGCGGNEIAADEVPVSPPTITVPESRDAGPEAAADGGSNGNGDASADATATPTPEQSSGTTGGTSSGGATTGGTTDSGAAATPESTGGATDQTQAPQEQPPADTGGAGATDEGLDQFCADNPGAC